MGWYLALGLHRFLRQFMLVEENMPLAEKSTHSEWFISDSGGGAVGLDASLGDRPQRT